jgi:hypothetical protein
MLLSFHEEYCYLIYGVFVGVTTIGVPVGTVGTGVRLSVGVGGIPVVGISVGGATVGAVGVKVGVGVAVGVGVGKLSVRLTRRSA